MNEKPKFRSPRSKNLEINPKFVTPMTSTSSSRYLPLYDPINTNGPTSIDLKIDATLKTYMDAEMPLETDEEMYR